MTLNYARKLFGRKRTREANRQLGWFLAFFAGAINAVGIVSLKQSTSHMTGLTALTANNLVFGSYDLVIAGLGGIVAFVAGAACAACMVHFGRRSKNQSEYALPLLFEALILGSFCLATVTIDLHDPFDSVLPLTVMGLCFVMGLQNAVITNLSKAEIRTTHMTGIVTDIGIELGKLVYWNRIPKKTREPVVANLGKLGLLASLVLFFFMGGVMGAAGYQKVGHFSVAPFAILMGLMAFVPVMDDIILRRRRRLSSGRSNSRL